MMDDTTIQGLAKLLASAAPLGSLRDRAILQKRLDLCKKIETELHDQGRHEDAEMLASLRKGYSSARNTARLLAQDNLKLRGLK